MRSRFTKPILRVDGLTAHAADGTLVLDDVSFAVPAGSVVAIVGPTGAGKTSLLNAITGVVDVDAGRIVLDGAVLDGAEDGVRRRIGYVPQQEALHPQLGLSRTLEYSASLRLPAVSGTERAKRVAHVLDELGLEGQAHLPVASLSGGQRKRAGVAVELIAEPDVLLLDEPTSGLDPGYEKAMLHTLRALADRGRTVLTVTHSLQALARCDLALFLAPGGRVAFYGPPSEALKYFGSRDPADVFMALDDDAGWRERFRRHPAYRKYVEVPAFDAGPSPLVPPHSSRWSQLGVLVRRYLDLLRADRRHLLMLCLQGPVLGSLLWAVLTPSALRQPFSSDAITVAVFVVISATWLGAASTVREIVKEQHIVRREHGGGLDIGAYVASKAIVLGALTVVQAAVMAAIALARQHPLLPGATVELVATAGMTALAAVALGLLLSAAVDSPDKALSLLPVTLVGQLVLSGGWARVLQTPVLHQLADVTGSRWGVQAFEATLRGDRHAWLAAVAALAGLTVTFLVAAAVLVRYRVRPRPHRLEIRGAALVPLCALSCAIAVVGLGASRAKPAAPPARSVAAAPARVSSRVSSPEARKPHVAAAGPTTSTAPQVSVTTVAPVSSTAAPTPIMSVAPRPAPAAAPTMPIAASAPPTTGPPVYPPATAPPTTAPPVTVATPTANTASESNWATLVQMAMEYWAATHSTR